MRWLGIILTVLLLLGGGPLAFGQDYPNRPIRFITPAQPGGTTDILARIIGEPDVRQRIAADGSEPVGSTPEQFRKFLHADMAKWAKIVRESSAKVD